MAKKSSSGRVKDRNKGKDKEKGNDKDLQVPSPPRKPSARGRSSSLNAFKGVFDYQQLLAGTGVATTVSFLVLEGASKSVAVNAAVTNQLHAEGRWPPNDLTAVMGTDYNCSALTMRNFLAGVASALATSLPPYKFTWNGAFANAALSLPVSALMGKIELATQ